MIKPKLLPSIILSDLNALLKHEYYAFYLYRHIGNYLQNWGFKLAAKHFFEESAEELEHAKKIEDFIVLWNGEPNLPSIKVDCNCENIVECIEKAYETEYSLYEKYEEVSAKIFQQGDICVFDFLKHFRTIQVESVGLYADMINILEGVDENDKTALLLIEQKLF